MKTSGTAHSITHLTNDQINECLINGAPAPECREHFSQCPHCRQEIDLFLTSVGGFNRASLAWSESQPSASLHAASASNTRHNAFVPFGWALAAAALLAIGLPAFHHERAVAPTREVVATATPEDSDAQIAQDNNLLQSVNMALAQNDPSPIRDYELTDETSQAQDARQDLRTR